jgi:O-antigen/teichoic acid export membrane protein
MLSNGLWSTAGSVSASIAVTVASVVTARILGPRDFGRYVYAVFLYGTAAQLALWGLPGAVTRFVAVAARDEPARRAVVARALTVGLVGTLLASGGLSVLALLGVVPRSTALLAALVVLAMAPTQLIVSLLAGREQFRTIALWQLAIGFSNPLLTIVVLALGGRVTAVLLVDVAVTAAGLVVLQRLARPLHLTTTMRAPAGFWRYAGAYAGLILLGIVVFQRSEVVVLQALRTSREVALYGVAFGLSQLVTRLTGPALGVLTPAFARMHDGTEEVLAAAIQRAINVAMLLGVALSALGATLAPAAVRLLYGQSYQAAGNATALLFSTSWLVLLIAVVTPLAQAGAHMRFLVALNGLAAAVNILAAVVLVHIAGVMGAAAANVLAQGLVALGLVLWARHRLPALSWRPARLLLPAAVAVVAGLGAAQFPPPVALALGVLVALPLYLLVARRTGALDDDTVALLPPRLRSLNSGRLSNLGR